MSIYLKTGRVKPEWTDYNGHMNLSFYIHIFDTSWEVLLEKFNIGEESAINQKKTTFAVESHTTYYKEVKAEDEVDINLLFLDFDKKRLVYKLEMIHKKEKYLASTIEVLALYVDLNTRKVSEFEDEKIQIMDNYIKQNNSKFNNENLKFSSKLKK